MMQIDKNALSLTNLQLIAQLLNVPSTPLTISLVGGGGKTHLAFWLANLFKQQGHRVCVTTTTKMYLPRPSQYDYIDSIDSFSAIPNAAITFVYQSKIQQDKDNQPIKVQGLTFNDLNRVKQSNIFNVIIVEADGAKQRPIKAPAGHEPCIPEDTNIVIGVTGAEVIFSRANPAQIHRWDEFSQLTGCSNQKEIDHSVLKSLIENPQGMFKHAPRDALRIWVINKYDQCKQPNALLKLANNLLAGQPQLSSIWITQLSRKAPIKKVLINKGLTK